MLIKIDNSTKPGKQVGGFGIQILYPGTVLPNSNDTGFATIGRKNEYPLRFRSNTWIQDANG
jgi:hypothetical protein